MKILKNIKQELLYNLYSKTILFILGITVLFICFNLYLNVDQLKQNYSTFERSSASAIERGENIDELISQLYNVSEETSNGASIITVDNAVAYDYNEVANSLYLISNNYLITHIIEISSFIIFSLLFSIMGLNMISYDYKYRIIKLKSADTPWYNILLSKLVAGICAIFILVIIAYSISFVFGIIIRESTISNLDLTLFNNITFNNDGNILIQLLISFIFSILFFIIGMFLGVIVKNTWVSLALILSYNLFIPNLGVLDLKNVISTIAHQYFNFEGNIRLFTPLDLNLSAAYITLISFFLVFTLCSFYIFSKRSKYV